MTTPLALVYLLTAISSAGIVATAWLFGERARWRAITGRQRRLRRRALRQRDQTRDELFDERCRTAAQEAHCLKLLDERNTARNALLHASEELNRERLLRACAGRGFFRCETGDA